MLSAVCNICISLLLQLAAEPPKLAEYQTYIDFELKEGDPARVQITFERTLSENCLVPDMWVKYTTYLVSTGQCWSRCYPYMSSLSAMCAVKSLDWFHMTSPPSLTAHPDSNEAFLMFFGSKTFRTLNLDTNH